jgi:hypothetical protein
MEVVWGAVNNFITQACTAIAHGLSFWVSIWQKRKKDSNIHKALWAAGGCMSRRLGRHLHHSNSI